MNRTPGFLGARLVQAREARLLTATSLAEMIGVKSANISHYEHGKQSPSPEVMERIADILNQPVAFFMRPMPNYDKELWWRAMSSATKGARARAQARHSWLREIVAYLSDYVDFPAINIPNFNLTGDVQTINTEMIEEIASQCRAFWKLGDGPIADVVLLLENNGAILSKGELVAESLDAFSQWPTDSSHPFIFLGGDKASAVRSRHDASHELGHLILHRNVDVKAIRNPALFKLIESQAHRFSGAFNLPAKGFADQLWAPTLDAFLALKPHWKTSIAGMIKRCEHLGILSEEQGRRAWINMNRRGWRKEEPLDNRIVPEKPRLLRRSFELLVDEGIKTPQQIVSDLALNPRDIEALACLDSGYLSGEIQRVTTMPQLKEEVKTQTGTGNLIRFAPRKN